MSLPGFVAKKVGMTQIFDEETGAAWPVTVLEVPSMTVVQVKTKNNDGYSAIQVGFSTAKQKHLSKPEQGHFKKAGVSLFRTLQEFRVSDEVAANFKPGDVIDPLSEAFGLIQGQKVAVTGSSIGKGFQGATKRWNFGRGPMTHGSKSHRLPGSIGAGTTPGRVYKGLKMATNMGNARVTIKNLPMVRLFPDKRAVLLKGAVPGVEGGLLTVQMLPEKVSKAVKK